MKTMKKIASLALALLLTVALAAPAFAVEEKGSITITDTAVGQTYHAYRLLDLKTYADTTPDTPEDGQYLYVVNAAWKDFFETEGANGGADYVVINPSGNYENDTYVTWKPGADPAGLAAAARLWINGGTVDGTIYEAHNVSPVSTATSTADGATFTGLDLGYYLIDSTVGTTCFLDTTNPNVSIAEKNELPTVTKKIVDGVDLVDEITASYGDTITFQLSIKFPSNEDSLTINDTMAAGLSYVEDSATVTEGYSLTPVEGTTFTLIRTGDENTTGNVTVTYAATLDVNAQTATALTNSVNLTYGADQTTTTSTVTVYTYEFDLVKTRSDDTVLDGATFKLYAAATGDNEITVRDNGDGTYSVDPNGDAIIEAGNVTIKGLADGTYYLEEIAAPEGYNKLATRAAVNSTVAVMTGEVETGKANNEATVTDGKYVSGGVQVINLTGAEMPSTGGIGTTIFYIVGGLLVVGAVVLLVTRKRAGEEE